jgi:Domain of unknown function (DUF4148)
MSNISTKIKVDLTSQPFWKVCEIPQLFTLGTFIMKTLRKIALTLPLITMTLSGMAEGGYTRDQVKAELAEARRTGNIVGNGESGLILNEQNPQLYPAKPVAQGKTREQAKADLAEARRTGTLAGNGETGQMLKDQYPHQYPVQPVLMGKSREQVRSELAEARLLGDIQVGEESRTLAEQFPQRYAKVRAEHAAYLKRLADERASHTVVTR